MLLVLVSFFKINAQKDIVFGLEKEYTKRHIRLNGDKPYVYSVVKNNVVIEKNTRIKKKSTDYENLKNKISDFEDNVVIIKKDYQNNINKYDSLQIAVDKVNLFLSSQKPLELSRELLIESQEILNQFDVAKLVYADDRVNSDHKMKFSILSSSHTNLRLHLKEVARQIADINVKPPSPPNEEELAEMKEKLRSMKSYVIVDGPKKKTTKSKLIVAKKINNIPTELEGEFVMLDNYTIITKDYNAEFKKGILIEMDLAKKKGLINKGYAKETSKMLVQNISSKKRYILDGDFLKKYAFTFNGKFRYQAKHLMSSL